MHTKNRAGLLKNALVRAKTLFLKIANLLRIVLRNKICACKKFVPTIITRANLCVQKYARHQRPNRNVTPVYIFKYRAHTEISSAQIRFFYRWVVRQI